MYEWLKSIPLFWGKITAVVLFVGIVIWAWFRPKKYIFKDAPDQRWWRDLRIWTTVLLGLQIIIYLSF
ncbi:MAG: hypothetical protein JSV88_03265 [Candidatus Aminicenantes bacterium]|nr:MAG: hypothetical protein JSV88_03265 [Candidatus Aminicenantes bacterium]